MRLRYDEKVNTGSGSLCFVCPLCGAMVADKDLHDDWHSGDESAHDETPERYAGDGGGTSTRRAAEAKLAEDRIEQLPTRDLPLGGHQRGSGRRFLPGQCHLHPSGEGCRCTQ